MKKITAVFITLALIPGLCACTSSSDTPATAPGTSAVPAQGQTPTQEPTSEPTPEPVPSAEIIASGDCGENVTWTLDNYGLLTISGTGPMEDYRESHAPWFEYRSDIIRVIIENGVTGIGVSAFSQCEALLSATIPDSVTGIGSGAFMECYLLPDVTIPNSVTSIGNRAFFECYSLTGVTIPDSVVSIGVQAFAKCTGLAAVTIPDSVTSIDLSAFASCDNLTDVFYGGSEEQWSQIGIRENNDLLLNAAIHFNS